ncbi:hypothetical protein CSPB12327_07005 [Campylobacter sp. RM12327]|uniref:hypothetical protein n=1 Tax=Campylobacter sputorum TaxID=206 RepID=UPI00125F3D2A|nr:MULTISPECIES: hypothetical protein [Campylobacter]ASM40158.1 hypothetical protein CSPB_0944 [Campylobacter sputorum]MBE7358544.1 hypothetical protein [Campylobacter sp. RM11302]MBF6669886.1 hypothetical protein [Campylobacter sp. RM12327]MBF6675142.1 hypothetical protein [Campylobacter sp. RM13538]MBF6676436.1 hypothetical protein [Campylobacter sp. RM12321]
MYDVYAMITKQEKELLKLFDKYKNGMVGYLYSNIIVPFTNLEIIIETNQDDLYDICNEDYMELNLLYDTDLSRKISIKNISIQIKTHPKKYFFVLEILKKYYEYFSKIPTISIGSSNSGWCPYYDLFYKIMLSKDIGGRLDFFEDIIKLNISNIELNFVKKYYEKISWFDWQDFKYKLNLTLNGISSIALQTKVRRLAYIKMIMGLFYESNNYPDNVFNRKIELEADKRKFDLLSHINTKGIIEISRTGNSPKAYIDFAISLRMLYIQNNRYALSKFGKVFNVLRKKLDNPTDNYFILQYYEKIFFLFFILQNDNFYFWSLLEIIYIQGNKTTIKNLKSEFKEYIIKELRFIVEHSKISNKEKIEMNLQIKKIINWKESYLEHIVEPRVNWMLDLDLLDKDEFLKNNIILSQKGLKFLSGLSSYYDIFQEKFTIVNQLLCMDFFSLMSEVYSIKASYVDKSDIILVKKYIDESFRLFKTMAPNRVTASQAIIYSCFLMLFKEEKIIDPCDIQKYLSGKENREYIFDWYKTENDGFIRKKE